MTSDELPHLQDEPRWHGRLAVIIMVVLTLSAMGRIATDEFVIWDDPGTIYENPWLAPPTIHTLVHYWMNPAYGIYIPVTYTVWAGIALLAKVPPDPLGIALNPWLFHGASLVFHLLAVLTAYRILRLLNADVFAAGCGALLFGVHPIQVEAVAWASGLKDVLAGMFSLLALWQFTAFALSDLRGRASGLRYLLATLAFMFAMLAKPSAMTLPLTALVIDRWAIGRPWRRVLPSTIGWAALALPIAAIALLVQDGSNTPMPALWLRPLVVFDSLAFYLWKLAWPVNLIIDYGRNTRSIFEHGWCYWDWIFPVGIGIILISNAKKRPVLLAAGAVFVSGCLPVLGFAPALYQYFTTTTDHYLYSSMFGPALGLAWLLSVWPAPYLRALAATLIVVLSAMTFHQAGYWRNERSIFAHDIKVNPGSYVGHMNLGGVCERDHDLPDAIAEFQAASRIIPEYPAAWGVLAEALKDAGKVDESLIAAKTAVDLQTEHPNLRPAWPQDNELLGQLLFDQGRFAEATPYMQAALDQEPLNTHLANELKIAKERAAAQSTTNRSTEGSIPTR